MNEYYFSSTYIYLDTALIAQLFRSSLKASAEAFRLDRKSVE